LLGEARNEMKFYCVQKFIFFLIFYPLFIGLNILLCFMYDEAYFSFYMLPVSPTCIASELINPKE